MKKYFAVILIILMSIITMGCTKTAGPSSATGISRASADVTAGGVDGLTTEQSNVIQRLEMDNDPGATKYLYVTSSYTGNLIMFSTVQGKVTSSGKRLNPYNVSGSLGLTDGFVIEIGGGSKMVTQEVLQDDGTYGSSIPYLFWWDVKGTYRQIYPNGGIMIQISDQPLNIPSQMLEVVISD